MLERRQVTFDANLPSSTPHRRMRTSHELPSLDNILTSSFTGGPSPLGKVSPSRPKPPLARRAVFQGRHKSRGVGRGLRDRLGSGDLDQVFAGGDRDSDADIPTTRTARPGLQRAKSSRRVISALPAGLGPNAPDLLQQGTMAGLTDAGDRALRVARALQASNDESDNNYLGETAMSNAMSGSSGLPDLLSIMEAKRDQDQGGGNSRGSKGESLQGGRKAGSRNAGGGSRSGGSRNGGSLFSGGASGARSRGESSGARRGRPFFGVTSPW